MKTFLRFLCTMALMLPFVACDPDADNPGGNNGNDDNNGLTIEQVTGTWQSSHIMVNDEDMTVEMRITMNADGSGYLDDPNDVFHYTLSGMNVVVTPPNGSNSYTFTVESITATEMVMSGSVIPGTDQQVSFKGWFTKVEGGDNPGGDDPSDDAWVDLGLPSGLLWASCNVGAEAPEEFGDYYAWGEIHTKDSFVMENYRYGYGFHELTKYCNDASYGLNGYTDDLTVLQPYDDAATVQMGDGARTPTKDEWEEMAANTTHEWTTLNGVNGYLFTAPNGNSIFLPAADIWTHNPPGYNYGCYYWTSSLNTTTPYYAHNFSAGATWFGTDFGDPVSSSHRFSGISVRAVRAPQK
jgi:hypothetical protein